MNDTSEKMHKVMLTMMKNRNGEERLKMGASMCDMAKDFVLASFKSGRVKDIRTVLFMRFYGNDFDKESTDKIVRYFSELHKI